MKPYHLIISAFGPYAKEVEIPFFKLGKEGIFLITGDTGAGKTTIFDAICFALFGEVSGSNREVDSLRSDFALKETKTFVDMTFFHREEQYRIVRNPAYVRPKMRSAGTTTQTADASLHYPDGHVVTGYGKTKAAIEELLGLDAKQFKQIAMIAQGEFLKMLYADSSTRGQIFRKLFQTECYADFQKKLKEMEKEKRTAFTDSGKRLETYLQQAGFAEGILSAASSLEEGRRWLKEEEQSLSRHKEQMADLEKQIQQKVALQIQAESEEEWIRARMEAETSLAAMETERKEQEEKRDFLNKQRKALDYIYPLEKAWNEAKQEVSVLEAEQISLMKQKEETERYLHREENMPEKIQQRKVDLEQKKQIFAAKTAKEEQFRKKAVLLEELKQCSKKKEKFSEEKENQEAAIAKAEEICRKSHMAKEQVAEAEKELILWTQQDNTLKERKKMLLEADKDRQEISDIGQVLEEKRSSYRKQEQIWKSAAEASLEAERLFLREQAGFLAEMLEEDMPCPVCGSKVHPAKAVPSSNAPTQEVWKNLQEQADKEKEFLNKLRAEGIGKKERLSYLQEGLEKCLKNLDLPSVKLLQEEIEKNRQQIVLWQQRGKDLQKRKGELIALVEAEKQEAAAIEKRSLVLQRIVENLQAQEKEYSRLEGRITAMEEEIGQQTHREITTELEQLEQAINLETASIRQKETEYAKVQTRWERTHAILKENEEKQKERRKKEEQAAMAFQKQLAVYGFADKESYGKLLPLREELEQAENDSRKYFLSLSNAKSKVEQLQREFSSMDVNVEQLKAEISVLQEKKDILQRDYEERRACYTMRQDALFRSEEEWKRYEKEKESYLPLKELADTAAGDISGMDRIPFEQFIQGVYFEKIVAAANLRFQDMTDGRYLLLRAEEASDRRIQSGLALEVMDYFTGKRRSIKSLSGGEAFKASLCLALGLSDMIQQKIGGIQIDAMFIDEGFGSLDEQSREQAVIVLQKLSLENRLIGIISHVTELKNSIEKKIIVKKGMQGSQLNVYSI